MKVTLNQAQKRAASFASAVLVVLVGSLFVEPTRSAFTSTLGAAALLGLPVAFVFLVGLFVGKPYTATAQQVTRGGSHHE